MRFKPQLDSFFGEGNWECLKKEDIKSKMYTTLYYDEIPGSEEAAGRYRDWYISFSNRYGEEEVWRITNHVYKINNNKYGFFSGKRYSAKQALAIELMDITFEQVEDEVMNEIILDVLTEEEVSCIRVGLTYRGGNLKPKIYSKLLKEPWFKANEVSAVDYLATDLYDFYLDIGVAAQEFEALTEEQQQHVLDSFEEIQDKLKEAYGENAAYDMYWGEDLSVEYGL